MGGRGFVFSLDAFVAFVLIMITINLLIFTIGTPKPYYAELESAHILAHDTLQVLATSSDPGASSTYLERILNDNDIAPGIMRKVAGGGDPLSYRPIIPKGYSYVLQYLNLTYSVQQPGAQEEWHTIYNASNDASSDRYGKRYTKLQASSTTFLSVYTLKPMPGESSFCYAGCTGYGVNPDGTTYYAEQCDKTPCNVSTSNFRIGENRVQVLRLIVYT